MERLAVSQERAGKGGSWQNLEVGCGTFWGRQTRLGLWMWDPARSGEELGRICGGKGLSRLLNILFSSLVPLPISILNYLSQELFSLQYNQRKFRKTVIYFNLSSFCIKYIFFIFLTLSPFVFRIFRNFPQSLGLFIFFLNR